MERGYRLAIPPAPVRPVVFSSHAGTREEPNLLPLFALALPRFGVPVLVHGALNGDGRVATAHVLRELGVMPCASLPQVETQLDEHKLAFVPTAILAPGLADLLALKSRLGFNDFAQLLAKLLNPFEGEALLAIAAGIAEERRLLREFLCAADFNALLLAGTEGEAFANPRCRPELEYVHAGRAELLFEAEGGPFLSAAVSPPLADPASTARWIRRVLDGETPLPLPLVNQLACFLYGAGYTDDLNQAKAIVAVETGSLIAV
jgi:anthranilate phosphoribosyltransferase